MGLSILVLSICLVSQIGLDRNYYIMVILEAARTRLNGLQQAAVAVGSAVVGAIMNPGRGDLVAAMGETTEKTAFQRVLKRMKNNPEGRTILKERPRIISSTISHVWDLPPTTFGGAYATFMQSRNFSPDDRVPVRFFGQDEDELCYVIMRSREVHDVCHTLFGLDTNLTGELALKVIEFQQMQLPMAFISFVGSSIRFNRDELKSFYSNHFPWAFKAGLQCTDLMSVYYEKYFDEDLEEVRKKWSIIPAPQVKRN